MQGTKIEDWKWIDSSANDLSNQQNNYDQGTSGSEKDYKYFEDSTFKIVDGFFISKRNIIKDSKIAFSKSKEDIETFSSPTVIPIINQSKSTIIQAVLTKTTSSFSSKTAEESTTNPSTSILDWSDDTPSNKERLHFKTLKKRQFLGLYS